MGIKKKHIQVILFSSIIIASVFITTLVGYTLYIQWKKDAFTTTYRSSVYKLTAELFKNDIPWSKVKLDVRDASRGREIAVFEGAITNNTGKTLESLLIEISFVDPDGRVLYKDWVDPLTEHRFWRAVPTDSASITRVLLPGETLIFRHNLSNCPREIVKDISGMKGFAKSDVEQKVKYVYSIEGLKVS